MQPKGGLISGMHVLLYLLIVNLAAYFLYWWDKRAARRGNWRVSEAMLLGVGFIGGSPAAFAAQRVLRHKTRKTSFQIAFWALCVVQIWLLLSPPALLAPLVARVFA